MRALKPIKDFATLQSLLDSLPAWGERRALALRGDFGFRWWSYARLHANALRAAASLRRRNLTPGDRVLLWAPNSPEWVAYLLGASLSGLVVVPVDAAAPLTEVERIIEIAGARLLLFGAEQSPSRSPIPSERIDCLERVPTPADSDLRAAISSNDPAVILFTAGSSGEARGVVLTHANLTCQMRHFYYWRPVIRMVPTRLLAPSPLSHVQGLMLGVCVPLSLGISVVYTHSIEPLHLQRTLREARTRAMATVPRVLALLEQSLRARSSSNPGRLALWRLRRRTLGSRFHVIFVGGATLPSASETFWRRCGCVVVQGYGSTETAAFAAVNRPLLGTRGSIGLPVHNSSIRLSAEGEILIRGPHISPQYIGEEATNLTADGFLRSGDLARQDRRGRLFFLGRLEDRIVTAEGHTLHPNTIEAELRQLPGVQDVVVLALAIDGLEQVHATLLLDPSNAPAARLIQQANQRLPASHRIRSWSVWPEPDFPRGALAKIRRDQVISATREHLRHPQYLPPPHAAASDSVEAALADPDRQRRLRRLVPFFRQETPPGNFPQILRKSLDLGLDSIEAAELMTMLHEIPDPGGANPAPLGTEAIEFPPPSDAPRQSPGWQTWPGAGLLRGCVRTILLDCLLRTRLQVHATGLDMFHQVEAPVLFVFDAADREHGVEFLALLRALPGRFRRRLIVLVGDRIIFASYFFRKPEDSLWRRWYTAFMVRFGVPCVVPYVLSPGGTVQGIRDSCAFIARGMSPIITWSPAAACIAADTQIDILPVRLAGPRKSWFRANVTLRFEAPVRTGADLSAEQIFRLVESRLIESRSTRTQLPSMALQRNVPPADIAQPVTHAE